MIEEVGLTYFLTDYFNMYLLPWSFDTLSVFNQVRYQTFAGYSFSNESVVLFLFVFFYSLFHWLSVQQTKQLEGIFSGKVGQVCADFVEISDYMIDNANDN